MPYVIYDPANGVYLGNAMGFGFWSKLDPVGQDCAVTFPTIAAAEEHMSHWDCDRPKDAFMVEVVADMGDYASMAACVSAGLPGWSDTSMVPDVGDIVEYGMNSFRTKVETWLVKAWLKPKPPDPSLPGDHGDTMMMSGAMRDNLDSLQRREALMEEIVRDLTPTKPGETPLVWCHREEATHLSLSGICGTVAAIGNCRVVSRVSWPQSSIDDAVAYANRLADKDDGVAIRIKNRIPKPPAPKQGQGLQP